MKNNETVKKYFLVKEKKEPYQSFKRFEFKKWTMAEIVQQLRDNDIMYNRDYILHETEWAFEVAYSLVFKKKSHVLLFMLLYGEYFSNIEVVNEYK